VAKEVIELYWSVEQIGKAIRAVRGETAELRPPLLLVDEADRLNVKGLEAMRDICDRNRIAVVLIGMPGIDKKLSRYAQLYSRVRFVHEFRDLSREELRGILEGKWNDLGMSLR